MRTFKVLICLGGLLLAQPARADNCVAVVFYDGLQIPPLDLTYRIVPWSGVDRLSTVILQAGLQIAAVHVYYDQFGSQGGPTSDDYSTDGSWNAWLGMQYIAPTIEQPREQLVIGKFEDDSSVAQYQGFKTTYMAALDSTENVRVIFPGPSRGGTADRVLDGSTNPEAKSSTIPFLVGRRADRLGVGEIRDTIRLSGCP